MADPRAAARWRRDAALARSERNVLAAVRAALAALADYTRHTLAQSGLDHYVLDDRAPAWRDALSGRVTPAIYEAFTAAWELLDRGTGIDPTLHGTRYLEGVWNRLVGASDEVFDRVRGVIEAGRQEGLHPSVVAKDVDAMLSDTANWEGRARTIARTETLGANNAGARASAEATAEYLGYSADDVMRVWLATGDDRTRESHQDADGQTIYGLDATYQVGASDLAGPGDPDGDPEEVINCRCTEQFWYPGDPEYVITAGGAMTRRWTLLAAAEGADEPLPVIVCALPAANDPVHGIGEEQKHSTLCYLGPVDGVDVAAVKDAIDTWLTLADTAPHTPEGGMEDVTGVDNLGDGGARVWMIEPGGVLSNLRDGLMGLEPIGDLDGEHNEHPEFTPHVTVDYAEDGADGLDPAVETAAGNVKRITFDRLAVWAGPDQWEYALTGDPDSTDNQESTVARSSTASAARETRGQIVDRLVASGFFPTRAHAAQHAANVDRIRAASVRAAAGDQAPVPVESDDGAMAVGDDAPIPTPEVDDPYGPNPDRFHGIALVEDEETGDRRVFAPGAVYWDDAGLPMPFGWQVQDAPGHDNAIICGRIDTFERVGNAITYTGTWDLDGAGWETRRLVEGQFLRGISVDTDDFDVVIVNPDGTPVDPFDMMLGDTETEPVMLVEKSRLRSATACRVPAFAPSGTTGAYIANGLPEDLQAAVDAGMEGEAAPEEAVAVAALVAAGASYTRATQITERPPAAWYGAPDLDHPTPITISDTGRVFGHLAAWGTCFAGETEYLTEGGVRTLKETAGTIQRVLVSKGGFGSAPRAQREFGGEWMDAEVRSFGVQSLMKVTLRRFGQTKEVYATPEHRWLVTPPGKEAYRHSPREIVTTADLSADARLSPLFPKRKATSHIQPSQFGVAHGFTFGDGTRHRDGCRVDLFGEKDAALMPYFSLSTNWESANPNGVRKVRVANLPAFFKDRPSQQESLSYLYGWLAGYFAADGTVTPDGTPILFSATREHLEYVRDVCLRLGVGTSEIKTFMRKGAGTYSGVPGEVINDRIRPLHRITLIASTLSADFFIGAEHRRRFEARPNKGDGYTAWRVVSVEETDRTEEVYCAVVPEYENFTLVDNINVMNCHIGIQGTCVTPPHSITDYAHFAHGITDTDGGPIITGLLTMDTGHAAPDMRALPAAAHYDDTGTQFATVAVGEDDLGIWIAGSVLPEATAAQIAKVNRAGALSGDWRRIRGNLELVAALAVNVPGYPIPRLSMAASAAEGQLSLVAAGIVTRDVEAAETASRSAYDDVRAMVASALADERATDARLQRVEAAARRLRAQRAGAAARRIG